jgi:ABC-type polysaccharide/polyol phosphate transport system ATPase subunit
MTVRLATVYILEPDILIMTEVLAVGMPIPEKSHW